MSKHWEEECVVKRKALIFSNLKKRDGKSLEIKNYKLLWLDLLELSTTPQLTRQASKNCQKSS